MTWWPFLCFQNKVRQGLLEQESKSGKEPILTFRVSAWVVLVPVCFRPILPIRVFLLPFDYGTCNDGQFVKNIKRHR